MTPKYKYDNQCQITDFHTPNFNDILSPSITPTTKAWVSALIDLPSPSKKSTIIKSPKKDVLEQKLFHVRKLLKRKRAIITKLKNKIIQKYIERKSIFSQCQFLI